VRVVLLGPPGAGKGTQAKLLSIELGVPHVSTGDLFRDNISRGTDLGRRAEQFMQAGNLVPSEITNGMVAARVAESDAAAGFVLDGYPRTVDQAEALTKILKELDTEIDHVLCFVVSEDVVVNRMLSRGRADDTEDVIRNRLEIYRIETEPLLDYYDGTVVTVDGVGEVGEVNRRALDALGAETEDEA
jgi:adenylate kinase